MSLRSSTDTIDLLNDLAEFLEDQADADGGPDGYRPNLAMQLYTRVEEEIERRKRQMPTACCVSVATCTQAGRCCYYADKQDATDYSTKGEVDGR